MSKSVRIPGIVRIHARKAFKFKIFLYVLDFNVFMCICSLEINIVKQYRSPRSQLHIALIRNYLLNIVTITSLVWFWLSQTNKKVCLSYNKSDISHRKQLQYNYSFICNRTVGRLGSHKIFID